MSHVIEEELPKIKITKKQINKYLRRHDLANNQENRKRARIAIRRRLNNKKEPQGKHVTIQESAPDWQIIYGTQRVGGVITFAKTKEVFNGGLNKWESHLMLVVTIAAHQINAVRKVYFDDVEVTFPTNPPNGWSSAPWVGSDNDPKVFIQTNLGTTSQAALSQLVTDSDGDWTSNHRQINCAHVYLKLKYNEHLFPNGMPDISFLVEGKVLASFNPPNYPSQFSDNAVHCLYDFLTDRQIGPNRSIQGIGINVTLAEDPFLDDPTIEEGLLVCDELVPLANGGTEKRYTCNGTFLASESHSSIIEQMLSSFGGYIVDFGTYAYWMAIVAPKYRTPTVTITEDDLLSEVMISTVESLQEYFGIITGTYISKDKNYEETDFPPYYFTTGYNDKDDISLPCTVSGTMAQRLAKLEAYRRKFSLTARMTVRFNFYKLSAGDNVMVTLDRLNWAAKVFEVQSIQIVIQEDQNGVVYPAIELELKENSSVVYDWNISEEVGITSLPNLNFPVPGVTSGTSPSGLTATSGNSTHITQADGTIVYRALLTWSAPSDGQVIAGGEIQVEFKKTSESVYTIAPSVPGSQTNTYVYNVEVGQNYDFRVRGKQAGGLTGNYVNTQHIIQPATSTPPSVTNFVGVVNGGSIEFTWDPVYISNLAFYRIKKSTGGASWSTSVLLGEVVGQPFTTSYDVSATYKIKAVNNQGIESTVETDHVLQATITTGNPLGLLLALTKD